MKLNQNGQSSGLALSLVVAILLLVASVVFGAWAFSSRQDYKTKSDQMVATAVASAEQQQQAKDSKAYALEAEDPLTTYDGPEAYGSLIVNYPKTWSSFVDTSNTNSNPIDGYFFPGTLPSVTDDGNTNFALRVQVNSQSYSSILQQYESQQQAGQVTVRPYSLPKLPNVVGVEVTGQLMNSVNGTQVVLPLRNETLLIWTEGSQYLNDFNNNILPNFSFSP